MLGPCGKTRVRASIGSPIYGCLKSSSTSTPPSLSGHTAPVIRAVSPSARAFWRLLLSWPAAWAFRFCPALRPGDDSSQGPCSHIRHGFEASCYWNNSVSLGLAEGSSILSCLFHHVCPNRTRVQYFNVSHRHEQSPLTCCWPLVVGHQAPKWCLIRNCIDNCLRHYFSKYRTFFFVSVLSSFNKVRWNSLFL